MFGVPYEIRSFLLLWAVGTILGATQKVDITYLMRTGVVRLLVAVLDANAVPTDADIMVNRNMYRIFFKVDEILRDEEDFNPDDDDLLGEEEDRAADQDMKEADDSSDGGDKAEREVHEPHTTNDSREMPSHKQAALEQDAIDISGVQLFDEASIKNLNETDDGSPSLVEGTLEDMALWPIGTLPPWPRWALSPRLWWVLHQRSN